MTPTIPSLNRKRKKPCRRRRRETRHCRLKRAWLSHWCLRQRTTADWLPCSSSTPWTVREGGGHGLRVGVVGGPIREWAMADPGRGWLWTSIPLSLPLPSIRGQAETQADRDHQPLLVPLSLGTWCQQQQQQSQQRPEEAGPEPQICAHWLPYHRGEPGHRAKAVPGGLREPPASGRDPQVWGPTGVRGHHPGQAHIPSRLLSGHSQDPQDQRASGTGWELSGQAPVPTRLLSGGACPSRHATSLCPQVLPRG